MSGAASPGPPPSPVSLNLGELARPLDTTKRLGPLRRDRQGRRARLGKALGPRPSPRPYIRHLDALFGTNLPRLRGEPQLRCGVPP